MVQGLGLGVRLIVILILFSLYPLFSQERKIEKGRLEDKEVIEFLLKVEKGIAGEKDLKEAKKLLDRTKNEYVRSWLASGIAQYYREIERDAGKGLEFLADHVLLASVAERWKKDVEKLRRSSSSSGRKLEGLGIPFPSVKEFRMEGVVGPAALEAARCMVVLGQVRDGLGVVDGYGKVFEGGEVMGLAYEGLGDIQGAERLWDRALESYGSSLKVLEGLRSSGGVGEWWGLVRGRVERKYGEVLRRKELEEYGEG